MSQWEHVRRDGHLKAWRQIGLKQTLGPEISKVRRASLPARRLWRWIGTREDVVLESPIWNANKVRKRA